MKSGMIAVSLLAAVLLGLFMGWLLLSSHSEGNEPAMVVGDRSSQELVQIARQIAGELKELREALALTGSLGRRVPAEGGAASGTPALPLPEGERLAAGVARLVAARKERPLVGAAPPPRAAADGGSFAPHPERIAAARQVQFEDRARAHFFWSYQKMLEHYGPPERMQ